MAKQPIFESDLLEIANQEIQSHQAYIEGMKANAVIERDGVLIFKGEYFLDANGLPTPQTTSAFNIFKYLAHQLSPKFTLK